MIDDGRELGGVQYPDSSVTISSLLLELTVGRDSFNIVIEVTCPTYSTLPLQCTCSLQSSGVLYIYTCITVQYRRLVVRSCILQIWPYVPFPQRKLTGSMYTVY